MDRRMARMLVPSSGVVLKAAPLGDSRAIIRMYTGNLINDLIETVERVCNVCKAPQRSHPEEFAKSLGLGAANRDLGLLFVVHPQLVRTFEPRDDFTDAVDIDEVRAVGSPK